MSFNFEQVGGVSKFRMWENWEKGEYIVGKYKGTDGFDAYNKPKHKIHVIETNLKELPYTTKEGKQGVNVIAAGDDVSLNSCTTFQDNMDKYVEEGDIIKIVYAGKKEVKTGKYKGKLSHVVEVYKATTSETPKAGDELL